MPYKDPDIKKQKQAEYARKYYLRNREVSLERTRKGKILSSARWSEYKSTLCCVYCGYNEHPAALDFHHVIRQPDNEKVYKLVANNSWKRLREEIKKCIVLCANCHRYLHNDVEFENKVLDKVRDQFKVALKKVHK